MVYWGNVFSSNTECFDQCLCNSKEVCVEVWIRKEHKNSIESHSCVLPYHLMLIYTTVFKAAVQRKGKKKRKICLSKVWKVLVLEKQSIYLSFLPQGFRTPYPTGYAWNFNWYHKHSHCSWALNSFAQLPFLWNPMSSNFDGIQSEEIHHPVPIAEHWQMTGCSFFR